MTKRTPTTPTHTTQLHKTAAHDVDVMAPSNAQTLPKSLKASVAASAKTKAKTQAQAVAQQDEDAHTAEQEDTTAHTAPSVRDDAWVNTSHDLQLAQANTAVSSPSAPSSVGEDLLRQAGPVTSKPAAQDTGFFSTSWGLPVALGAGALALAAGGGGGGGGDAPKKEPTPTPPIDGGTGGTTPPVTDKYTLTVQPMAGKFTAGVQILIYKNGSTTPCQAQVFQGFAVCLDRAWRNLERSTP